MHGGWHFSLYAPTGRCLFLSDVSGGWRERGYTPAKVKGMKAWTFSDPVTAGYVKEALEQTLATGKSVFLGRMVTKTGEEFEGRFDRVKTPSGYVVACVSRSIAQRALLSEKEAEVLLLICQDLTSVQIAKRIRRSVVAVEKYRHGLRKKLKVRGVAGMVKWAVRHGLI